MYKLVIMSTFHIYIYLYEYYLGEIILNWLKVNSVDELKALGNIKEVRSIIKHDLIEFFNGQKSKEKNICEMIKITSNSWSGLYDKICALRNFMSSLNDKDEKKDHGNLEDNIEYFKTEEDEIIFYLLEMEGKSRSEKLGITRGCFRDKEVAKLWRNNIYKKIHPDKTKNKNASKAAAKLNQLYKEMIGDV